MTDLTLNPIMLDVLVFIISFTVSFIVGTIFYRSRR